MDRNHKILYTILVMVFLSLLGFSIYLREIIGTILSSTLLLITIFFVYTDYMEDRRIDSYRENDHNYKH